MALQPAPLVLARRAVWLYAIGVTCTLGACNKVTADSIELWKTTEKGPAKLADAVSDRGLDPTLRAQATVALVELGKSDDVETTLGALPAAERWDVLKALIPLYMARMKDPAPEKALVFRDALFSVRGWAQPDDQARIDGALLPGIEQDLRAGHARNGRHSVEKILTAIGSPAGAMLAKLLGEPIPGYFVVAELLAKIGDESARQRGAASLVARAEHEHPVPEPMWKSIGLLGGPAAAKFLQDKVAGANHDEALAAVRALQQRRDPSVLAFALKTAGDAKADRAVRDEMFGVVETIGGLEARDGLVRIIQTDKDEVVRYRAFESLLVVAKEDGVIRGLEAFPAGAAYKKVDVDDLLVKLIEKLGQPARPILIKALESKNPVARMTAVLSLEALGKGPDGVALENVGKDGKNATVIKGFPAGDTIAKEATRVAAIVRSRS